MTNIALLWINQNHTKRIWNDQKIDHSKSVSYDFD
jgi:hypothetical protein